MTSKPRINVKSLADAMKQLRAALDNVASYQARNQQVESDLVEQHKLRKTAAVDVQAARANHDDLKKKLYEAEIESARLRGFVERVREDDAVRDPLVEVEDMN